MSKFSLQKNIFLLISIIFIILILPFNAFVFAEDKSGLEKLIFSQEIDGKKISVHVTPITPLVGTIFFSIDLHNSLTDSPISDATLKLILGEDDQYLFESLALPNPKIPGNYIANITVDHAGDWVTYIKIQESNGNQSQIEIPLLVQGSPLTAGLMGSILWGIVFCVIVSIGFYIWKNSK